MLETCSIFGEAAFVNVKFNARLVPYVEPEGLPLFRIKESLKKTLRLYCLVWSHWRSDL